MGYRRVLGERKRLIRFRLNSVLDLKGKEYMYPEVSTLYSSGDERG